MHVNKKIIESILSPLIGGADSDSDIEKFHNVNSEDENEIKGILKNELKEQFDLKSQKYKSLLRLTMSYYLTSDKLDFGLLYDSLLIAFDHPSDPKIFFIWLWEILFETPNFILENFDDISEENSFEELVDL